METNEVEIPSPSTSKSSTTLNLEQKRKDRNSLNKNNGWRDAGNRMANGPKKSRKPRIQMQKVNQEESSVQIFRMMQEQLHIGLTNCDSGRELEILHRTLRPDYHQMWLKCMEVKKDLILALQRSFPSVRLEVFGSTVMGIAFKDSDFDFYIELSREPLNMEPPQIIGRAMKILYRNGNFTNFLPISQARVPILKCCHIRTGYQCDINFSDSFGILNSPIVAKLLSFDPRIYELATIIKYWSKVHDCAGKNRISNYAMIWMLIFYLQQLDEPIVPPIIEFQKRIPPYFVNHFNFAFDANLPNQTKNQMRCSELLLGFFKFYKDFDFHLQVICPLYGKAYRKSEILDRKLAEFQRYEEILKINIKQVPMRFNKCICIQDPFEITHTIPGVISKLEFQKIIMKIGYAAETIENELSSAGESTKLLLLIFDVERFDQYAMQKIKNQASEARIKQSVNSIASQSAQDGKYILHLKPTDYHLLIVRDLLLKRLNDPNGKIDKLTIYRFWAENVFEFIILTMKDIFALKIDNITSKITDDSTKTDDDPTKTNEKTLNNRKDATMIEEKPEIMSPNQNTCNEFSKQFEITGSRDVFLARKQTKRITASSLNAEIIDSKKRFESAQPIQLKAIVKIIADTNNFNDVSIEFIDQIKTKKNNFYRTFLTNVVQNINNLLKVYFVHKNVNAPDQAKKMTIVANTNGQAATNES